jgi:hypothetical protein
MLFLCITAITLTFLRAATAPPQVLDPKAERDAFSVYATLFQPTALQPDRLKYEGLTEPIVLQAETEAPTTCEALLAGMSGEWAEVASNFRRENTRGRLLRAGLPLGVKYRLVSRKAILADDARVAAKHPIGGMHLVQAPSGTLPSPPLASTPQERRPWYTRGSEHCITRTNCS